MVPAQPSLTHRHDYHPPSVLFPLVLGRQTLREITRIEGETTDMAHASWHMLFLTLPAQCTLFLALFPTGALES